jgi:L-lactate dehydrogenase complex protein LldE
MDIQLFVPCFVDQIFPESAFNMVRVLEKAGCSVKYNKNQTCCGQPAYNAGFREDAREVCMKFLDDFAGTEYVVAPSASCVGFVRNYYLSLFDNSSYHNQVRDLQKRIFEFSEFLVRILGKESFGAKLDGRATYHDSCAGLRECRIREEPRKLLSKVKGLELIEMNDVETCCGFGGSFAVKFESISTAMADQKVTNALQTGANYIISTDLSCLMHLEGYIRFKQLPLKTLHLADVLANGWDS